MPKVLKAYMCWKENIINIVIMWVKNKQTQYCCIKEGFLHFSPSVGGEEKLETYSHAIYTVNIQI